MVSRHSALATKHVLVLVESSAAYGRACVRGIGHYARNHERWLIRHMPHDQMPVLNPNIPWKWDWDGVIARIASRRVVDLVRRLKLPTVDIMGAVRMKRVAIVDADHHRIVDLAVDHLVANGLTHLGFCGVPGLPFSDIRQRIFSAYPAPPGVTLHAYENATPTRLTRLQDGGQRWLRDLKLMRAWLEKLPKPVGIVACNDTRARHIIEVCMAAGLDVPREVAVVGVDNDDAICELCTPTLSSVDPNPEAVGFEAARMLEQLMQGAAPPDEPMVIAPLGVEKRESSDTEAFEHDDLNTAIRFIREHGDANINVGSIVAHVGASRSTLERRFRQHLGCTLHDYIQRHRIERVKRLLLETNYPAAQIARMLGFNTSTYFTAAFRKQVGMTPGQFRKRRKPRGG
ncbi:MAG: DNA-binding transcriptional regulator [Phycisphaeraceae bacterium]